LFAGLGVYLASGEAAWLAAGAFLTCLTLSTQMVRNRLSFFREWTFAQSGPITAEEQRRLDAPSKLERFGAVTYETATFFAPLLLLTPQIGTKAFLIALLIFQPVGNLAWMASVQWQASRLLRRPRRSIHAA
jgi:hypothetical protein